MTFFWGFMTNIELRRIQIILKQIMKSKKITHQILSHKLKVSTATIKRRLNGDDLSLLEIKEFGECLNVTLYEVIELSKRIHREPQLLTIEQEKLLASDLSYMNFFRMILAGQSFTEIKQKIGWTNPEIFRSAQKLEAVGLAKLLPGNRLITSISFPFKWNPNGPLTHAYEKVIFSNLVAQMQREKNGHAINQKFELALAPEMYEAFCIDIQKCYEKYRGISEIYLSSRIDWNHLISGVFFIDQFSIWDSKPSLAVK